MAKILIELEDTEEGGMLFKINADGLATIETLKKNTCVQNTAILLIDALKKSGVDNGKLPDLSMDTKVESKKNKRMKAR